MKRLVAHANKVATESGIPALVTPSALVTAQINTWLDDECAKLDRKRK